MHAAYYTSQKLFAPPDEDGTKLLAPGQNSLGMLGQIYGRMQIVDQEIRGGRQLVDTPLINPQDNRMVPNTFEGASWCRCRTRIATMIMRSGISGM